MKLLMFLNQDFYFGKEHTMDTNQTPNDMDAAKLETKHRRIHHLIER